MIQPLWYQVLDTRLPFGSANVYIAKLTLHYSQFRTNESLRVDTFLKVYESEKR
jgi:hypothetical protein